MINFIILIIATILIFVAFTFSRKINDVAVLIAVAIGCAVNANIYTTLSRPIEFLGLTFGIDSILYSLFLLTIIIRMIDYSVKDAQVLTLTAIVAIIISAIIEYVTEVSYLGYFRFEELFTLLKYFVSTTGTFISVWVMEKMFITLKAKKVNKYLIILILIAIGSIINAALFYTYIGITTGFSGKSLSIFLGNLLLRLFCVVLCQLSVLVYNKLFVKE